MGLRLPRVIECITPSSKHFGSHQRHQTSLRLETDSQKEERTPTPCQKLCQEFVPHGDLKKLTLRFGIRNRFQVKQLPQYLAYLHVF